MSRIFVSGVGAVSPAGWGVPVLRDALRRSGPFPTRPLERPVGARPLFCRTVPNPPVRPAFLAHPRFRRASQITHYAAAASLEAMGTLLAKGVPINRLGIIACLDAGCVQYSCRFFDEVLKNPATASPLLFPETVFSALASNISSLFEPIPFTYTLIGDSATFLQGVALAADWLVESRVDACLVVAAEEINWLLADAVWHLDRHAVLSAGAGVLGLVRDEALSLGAELKAVTNAHTYSAVVSRQAAVQQMRRELTSQSADDVLCDSLGDGDRLNAAEKNAWKDWPGARLSPRRILGEGLVAATAWQCIAAVDAIAQGGYSGATISVAGTNQQAIGARFEKPCALSVPETGVVP